MAVVLGWGLCSRQTDAALCREYSTVPENYYHVLASKIATKATDE